MAVQLTDTEVTLSLSDDPNTSCKILLYGATVYSWKSQNIEQLWLSKAAKLDGSKPVRGGIPLVFPVFGKNNSDDFKDLPQHGFARNSTWEFLGQTQQDPPTVQFGLGPENVDEKLYSGWGSNKDNDFTLILTIALHHTYLKTSIDVINNNDYSWDFNWLFHNYLQVNDIEDTLVSNLAGENCFDQLLNEHYEEKAPAVTFIEELDRIYNQIPEERMVQVIELGKVVHSIQRENLPDIVVWNPWVDKSSSIADFQPKDGFKKMVCIEPGYVKKFVTLNPGETWSASQIIKRNEPLTLQSV
ncbi:glucose-6-phosphate 1-epimerase [Ascoidea rubescens DSM 1968]|uniref:Glucose-6-phosphate 1-epimerase n=1 Tax=Ascoidea rubescens DSM 1968 TaxID=1344418 RepID=A0A1D2VR63_9ASCO|nr:glucose-6-phosphate 1-epimerase (hexose-6-phosphate mutarotase) [Ascoidea rubescens DSM 1968]ODV64078.1 glucose-6-phosphate 1-epimerase (hexose-6-phosphate mutarotase) [Ascoidea rubescens DSM 1968]